MLQFSHILQPAAYSYFIMERPKRETNPVCRYENDERPQHGYQPKKIRKVKEPPLSQYNSAWDVAKKRAVCSRLFGKAVDNEVRLRTNSFYRYYQLCSDVNKVVVEDICFICKEGYSSGEVPEMCNVSGCPKTYHSACLSYLWPCDRLGELNYPSLKVDECIVCPRHSCASCHNMSTYYCYMCPRALCAMCFNRKPVDDNDIPSFTKIKSNYICSMCYEQAVELGADEIFKP